MRPEQNPRALPAPGRRGPFLIGLLLALAVLFPRAVLAQDSAEREEWSVAPDFAQHQPRAIAVMPMDNFSLEPEVEKALYDSVYERLQGKGYARVSVAKVREVMGKLGVQTPGQLAGISLARLQGELNCDAVLSGRVEQSASVHAGLYDAIVVSCSLSLTDCASGKVLWSCEQWRAAHRQWQLDPFNMLINALAHGNASRQERVAWLVQEMFKTLPQGGIRVERDNLLNKAVEIKAHAQ